MGTRRSGLVLGWGLVGAFLLAGCGGGGGNDPLGKAVVATAKQGSEKVTLQAKMDFQGQISTVRGSGGFADGTGRLHLLIDTEGLGSSNIDQIFVKGVRWLRSPVLPTSLYGKHWLKLSSGERASFLGFDLSALTDQTPTAALNRLQGNGAVEVLGREKVGGVETTHYRKTLAPAEADVAYNAAEAWVDDSGLVRKVKLDLTAQIHPPDEQRAHIMLKMTFSEFGARVDVSPPPPWDSLDSKEARN